MGSSNFKQFNPNALNMTNDTDYNSSSYRLNGVVPGQAPSALHNKLFYQVSTMVSAIGQVLADAGKTVTDANLTSLIADLKDVFIQVPAFPKGYLGGPVPVYTSPSTVTFKAGMRARDILNAADMELASDVPVSLASSGAGGLDSGAEAANTWYYFYMIRKSGDGTTSVIASTINEAAAGNIFLPVGYDQKRQLRLAVRNNASSDILPFFCTGDGWVWYRDSEFTSPYSVVTTGTATSFTTVGCGGIIPPISRLGQLDYLTQVSSSSNGILYVRMTGSSATNGRPLAQAANAEWIQAGSAPIVLNASQQFDYKWGSNAQSINMSVAGYKVTEVA
jgi:hypothetical protein